MCDGVRRKLELPDGRKYWKQGWREKRLGEGGESEYPVRRTGLGPRQLCLANTSGHTGLGSGDAGTGGQGQQLRIPRFSPNSAAHQLCDQEKLLSLSGLQFIHLEDGNNRGNEICKVQGPEV